MKDFHPYTKRLPQRLDLRIMLLALAVTLTLCGMTAGAQSTNNGPKLRWIDASTLRIEGKGWADTKQFYDRLPAKAEGVVREGVWNLSKDSAGICVRFVTDATEIYARWTLRKEKLAMPHMPASGVSGMDLYVRHKDGWHWLGAARPASSLTTEQRLTMGMSPQPRECILYLPLYNGVEKVELGVPIEAKCEPSPAPPRNMKPVVFYGTSIVQGGCASRPGMAYPAILGRRLNWPTINLGFSGSALCEPEIAGLLAELDPAVYVIDPLPNMTTEFVASRMPALITKLREAHPKTPIVLIEHIDMGDAAVNPSRRAGYSRSNAELRKIFEQHVKAGDKKLFYIRGENLLGSDGQGTVDRVHPTDLGFMRMADEMEPTIKRALRASK